MHVTPEMLEEMETRPVREGDMVQITARVFSVTNGVALLSYMQGEEGPFQAEVPASVLRAIQQ